MFDFASYAHGALALPIGAVAVLSMCVGVWVAWHERGRRVSLSLLAATVAVAVYLGGFAMMVRSATPELARFWSRILYLGVPFIVPATYQFSMDLLGLGERRRRLILFAWLVGLLYSALAVGTDLLVSGLYHLEWGSITRLTLWNLPFIVWSSVLLYLALRDYLAAYRDASPVQKARIRLFAIPLVIASAAFVDYAGSFGLPVPPVGFVFLAIFLMSAAWAVAVYHLPDLTPAFAADQIVRTMAEPLLVCDDTGDIAFANPAAARLFGRLELVGGPLERVLGPEVSHMLLRDLPLEPVEVKVDVGRGDGESIFLAVSTSPIEGKRGRHVGTVIVARDIRERKAAARELRRSEQRFRALIEHARDTITIIDADGRLVYESPATQQVLGWHPEESLGTPIMDRVHPDDAEVVADLFREILEREGGIIDSEARIRTATGEYRAFEYRATNLLHTPAVRGLVVNARDITEERQLTAQLQQAQKMEAIGQLAGGVAHDFNNILTAIQGNVALLLADVPEGSPFRPELDEIRHGADRAGRLTDQLLSFSRRQVVRADVLSLNEVVRHMRSMLERLIGENVFLSARLEADPDDIRVDRGQLEQVVMNLVVNARDAVQGYGTVEIGTANVDIGEEQAASAEFRLNPGSYVVMTVTDDGHGFDEETRARIFEPFFTTKGPGKGTGLGLSTVYGSVRQADGFIGVESQPGVGTTFSVYFPRVSQAARREIPEAAPETLELAGEGEIVLVVEDEAPVRSLIVRVLERRGYRVLQAEDGRVALDVADRHNGPIDLLIADLVMPGMSGREVADRLAASYPEMGIILISGYTADEVVRKGILTGEREFLPKPFTPDALARKAAAVLGRSRKAAVESSVTPESVPGGHLPPLD